MGEGPVVVSDPKGVFGLDGLDWGTVVALGSAVFTLASAIITAVAGRKAETTATTFSTANTQANQLTQNLISTVSDALRTSQTMQSQESLTLQQQGQKLSSLEAKIDQLIARPPGS